MLSRLSVVSVAVVSCTLCCGQDRGGVDPRAGSAVLQKILNGADVSASLEYWGSCNSGELYPDFPRLRILADYSGSHLTVLQRVFVDDPHMRVTQDGSGMIRMVEDDVPTDILDVRIQHLSFDKAANEYEGFTSPIDALNYILSAPEVRAFGKAKHLGPDVESEVRVSTGLRFVAPDGFHFSGDLKNVTLRQALDYVLKTFPGFWLYENCRTDGGGRKVFFTFYENAPGTFPRRPIENQQ